jgi:hypothetical protein
MNKDILKNSLNDALQYMSKNFLTIKTMKVGYESRWANSLMEQYKFMAKCEIGLNNPAKAREYYFKSSRASLTYIKLRCGYYGERFPQLDKVDNFAGIFYNSIIPLLLSDNQQDLIEVAKILEIQENNQGVCKKSTATFYALKCFLIGNKTKALEYINNNYKEAIPYFRGLVLTAEGLIKNDTKLIDEGIKYEIFYFKNQGGTGTLFDTICENATAWVRLAQLFGFSPNTSSSFIIKDLLIREPTDNYEDFVEFYQALEIEGYKMPNDPKFSIKNTFYNWFKN